MPCVSSFDHISNAHALQYVSDFHAQGMKKHVFAMGILQVCKAHDRKKALGLLPPGTKLTKSDTIYILVVKVGPLCMLSGQNRTKAMLCFCQIQSHIGPIPD
jgi:hypothetical protein